MSRLIRVISQPCLHPINPWKCERLFFDERVARSQKQAFVQRIITHVLADDIAAGLPRGRGLKADGDHLVGPFLVVIAAASWPAMAMLPTVDHFMHKCLQYFNDARLPHMRRVNSNFMATVAVRRCPALRGKIPQQIFLSLNREYHRR